MISIESNEEKRKKISLESDMSTLAQTKERSVDGDKSLKLYILCPPSTGRQDTYEKVNITLTQVDRIQEGCFVELI